MTRIDPFQVSGVDPARGSRASMGERDAQASREREYRSVAHALQVAGRHGLDLETLCAQLSLPGRRALALLRSEVPGTVERGGRWYIGSNDPALRGRASAPRAPAPRGKLSSAAQNLSRLAAMQTSINEMRGNR